MCFSAQKIKYCAHRILKCHPGLDPDDIARGLPTLTKEMAADYAAAMAELGIADADVLGISQGGMIAQHLAIDHPHMG